MGNLERTAQSPDFQSLSKVPRHHHSAVTSDLWEYRPPCESPIQPSSSTSQPPTFTVCTLQHNNSCDLWSVYSPLWVINTGVTNAFCLSFVREPTHGQIERERDTHTALVSHLCQSAHCCSQEKVKQMQNRRRYGTVAGYCCYYCKVTVQQQVCASNTWKGIKR